MTHYTLVRFPSKAQEGQAMTIVLVQAFCLLLVAFSAALLRITN